MIYAKTHAKHIRVGAYGERGNGGGQKEWRQEKVKNEIWNKTKRGPWQRCVVNTPLSRGPNRETEWMDMSYILNMQLAGFGDRLDVVAKYWEGLKDKSQWCSPRDIDRKGEHWRSIMLGEVTSSVLIEDLRVIQVQGGVGFG